jgi:hypothetical protein
MIVPVFNITVSFRHVSLGIGDNAAARAADYAASSDSGFSNPGPVSLGGSKGTGLSQSVQTVTVRPSDPVTIRKALP